MLGFSRCTLRKCSPYRRETSGSLQSVRGKNYTATQALPIFSIFFIPALHDSGTAQNWVTVGKFGIKTSRFRFTKSQECTPALGKVSRGIVAWSASSRVYVLCAKVIKTGHISKLQVWPTTVLVAMSAEGTRYATFVKLACLSPSAQHKGSQQGGNVGAMYGRTLHKFRAGPDLSSNQECCLGIKVTRRASLWKWNVEFCLLCLSSFLLLCLSSFLLETISEYKYGSFPIKMLLPTGCHVELVCTK